MATDPAATKTPASMEVVLPGPEQSWRSRVAKHRRTGVQALYLAPALLFLAVFSVALLFELARMSFSRINVSSLLSGNWTFVGFDNYAVSFASGAAQRAAVNTVILVTVAVTTTLVLGLLVALSLQRNTWFNRLTSSMVLFLWALPPVVTGSVWKFMLSNNGVVPAALEGVGWSQPPDFLSDYRISIWSVSVIVSWASVAFASLVLRAGLNGVDQSLMEAAEMDGANSWHRFWSVVFPALRPVIIVQGLLTVLYSFRAFDFPFVMTAGGPGDSSTTLPYLAFKQSFGSLQFGPGAATAMLSLAVVVVVAGVFLFFSRHEVAE